jgi:hypothetical protein
MEQNSIASSRLFDIESIGDIDTTSLRIDPATVKKATLDSQRGIDLMPATT